MFKIEKGSDILRWSPEEKEMKKEKSKKRKTAKAKQKYDRLGIIREKMNMKHKFPKVEDDPNLGKSMMKD